ncbi:MAG TPA: tRNA-dihydrouridine synthase [Myxococcales bacterium]|nr:tRNA-dihydrouridine synthase [Myxococcales bacterium]
MRLKNRVLRASGTVSLDYELRFAEAGVGAIIASPGAAAGPDHIAAIQAHGCRYLFRLALPWSPHRAPSGSDIDEALGFFADAARLTRETGADGVEIDGGEGTLVAQFLGPGTDERPSAYRGPVEHRARLIREIVRAARGAVGRDFHLQVRLGVSSVLGLMAASTVQVVHWLEEDGIDAIHLAPEGRHPGAQAEAPFAFATRIVKEAARVPVLRNGRFETERSIQSALADESCDAVTLARPLAPDRRDEVSLRPAA